MEYTSDGVPVVLNATRPARGRHRGYSEHPNGRQPLYYQGTNALLMPADAGALMPTHHRSASLAVPGRPTSVIINNSQYDDYSPVRGSHHRHSSYGHDYYHHGDDDYEYPVHSPHWRGRAHSHAHSRSPSPIDPEMDRKLQKLADLERKEEEEEARSRFEEEKILKQARKDKKKKQEEELKKAWLEEQKVKELEEKEKAKKKKMEEDEKFRKRALETFGKAGYDEEYVGKIIKKAEKKEKKEGHEHSGHKGGKKMLDLARPTHIRVNRKYLEPETLELYDVPWDWDLVSPFTISRLK